MKKQDLLNYMDRELLDRLFGFCYARTASSIEAEELCSDVIYALVKAGNSDGDILSADGTPYAFIWRVARNVYADFSEKRSRQSETFYGGDPEDVFMTLSAEDEDFAENAELLKNVYRRVAWLTRAYREVMISYYLDGLPISEIARRQGTSENAIRQRLHSARSTIRNEVMNMELETKKPLSLDTVDYVIWGNGRPSWGDPRDGFVRQFSKHIVRLCKKKPSTAREISEELNVPTMYVEEELDLLVKGKNGKYGLLREMGGGRYALNFACFDRKEFEEAQRIYTSRIPLIADVVAEYVKAHEKEYFAFPYLNKKVDLNLILWSQVHTIGHLFADVTNELLKERYFADAERPNREFTVFGYEDNGFYYGGGCDGTYAMNLCGYASVSIVNIYTTRIKKAFLVREEHRLRRKAPACDPCDQRAFRKRTDRRGKRTGGKGDCGGVFIPRR